MDRDSQPSHFSGPERDVLLLTPRQKDFLINHLNLSMVIMNAHLRKKIRPQKIFTFCRRKFLILHGLATTSKAQISDRSQLSREENGLCQELEMHWRRKLVDTAPDAASFPLSVVMVEGRGLVPAYWQKNERGDILRVRRRHPLTLRALRSISQNRDNSELAFAALMPGHFLTVTKQ
jgi:hypothetical protein